ncbi:MAG: protein kinase, partial [Chitinivibrionales bacterium]|nr:protein kinase [Chitinivibrionales bacterium]MBD3358690.1 protein kinase [Chitinivibrionales bacterium]
MNKEDDSNEHFSPDNGRPGDEETPYANYPGSSDDFPRPTRYLKQTEIAALNPYYRHSELPEDGGPVALASGTIVDVVGEGGMARVYRIWNERLEVFRAVKVLLPNMDSETRGRFETEGKITAKLHHPNILEIHGVGDWQGLPYLEMEYIHGETLADTIRRHGPLPSAVCSAIAVLTARALDHAHNQEIMIYGSVYRGIIHRDLKPQNIMISSKGVLKLMDFGIARPSEVSIHTATGKMVGTLVYLSPEQLDSDRIDARTDIYSFGVILYELLAGESPFPQKSLAALVQAKGENVYKPLRQYRHPFHEKLAELCKACMAKNPEKRIGTAAELVSSLENIHRSITRLRPEQALQSFIENPKEFRAPGPRGLTTGPIRLPPLIGAGRSGSQPKNSSASWIAAGSILLLIGFLVVWYRPWRRIAHGVSEGQTVWAPPSAEKPVVPEKSTIPRQSRLTDTEAENTEAPPPPVHRKAETKSRPSSEPPSPVSPAEVAVKTELKTPAVSPKPPVARHPNESKDIDVDERRASSPSETMSSQERLRRKYK